MPALMKCDGAVLTAVASRDRERARTFFPAAVYQPMEYDELLESSAVDVVYLSLPNHLHEAWTLRALERGKHVVCEKPLGLSVASVAAMTAYAEQRGLLLYENIMYLHHPQHRAVREIAERGDIGRVKALRTAFGFTLPRGGWRRDHRQGGGALHDLARYPLSAALFHLAGESYQFAGSLLQRRGVAVAVNANGISSEGEQFSCSIGFEQQYECWYELEGEEGTIRLERAYTTPADHPGAIRVRTGRRTGVTTVPAADHFQLMIEHVALLIGSGTGFGKVHDDARRLSLLAEQLERSCDLLPLTGEPEHYP